MKHKPYTCQCCKDKTFKARGVEIENTDNVLLCNRCNHRLIEDKCLVLSDTVQLKVTGQYEDMTLIEAFNYRKKTREELNDEFWANRARVKELAMMDNQPTTGWDVHESY